ncbi:MAG: SCO1664 family protein [Anaerolineales bacterium]
MSKTISLQEMLTLLREGELKLEGLLPQGSNYTFLARVTRGERMTFAVYKPTKGEQPLWDFPEDSLAMREVAAFVVSEALAWNFVPPTVYREAGPHGPGSVQFFIQAEPEFHYFSITDADRPEMRRVALFDLLINNADRKGGHVLKDQSGKVWLIDHGIGFHAQNKLRTVIWEFAGESIPAKLLKDVEAFRDRLECDEDLKTALNGLLDPLEVAALRRRADRVLTARKFPQPGSGRSYPWPPV